MANVNDTDKFLVNRNGSSYYVEKQNLMAQLDPSKGDILLVNRGGVSYKIGAQDFIDSITPPSVINTPTLLLAGNPELVSPAPLTSSPFASIPAGALTHQSSDWQVSTDSGFATIVQQTLDDTSNLTSWEVDGLEKDTQYYARVRYKSTTGEVSEWSNVAQFTVSVGFNNTTKPGTFHYWQYNGSAYRVFEHSSGEKAIIGCGGETNATLITASGLNATFSQSGWTQADNLAIPAESIPTAAGHGLSGTVYYISPDGRSLQETAYGSSYTLPGNAVISRYSLSQNSANNLACDENLNWFSEKMVFSALTKTMTALNNNIPYLNIVHGNFSTIGTGLSEDGKIYDLTYASNSSTAGFTITNESLNGTWSGTEFKGIAPIDRGFSQGNDYGVFGLTAANEFKVIKEAPSSMLFALQNSAPANIKSAASTGVQVVVTTMDGRCFVGGFGSGQNIAVANYFVNGTLPTKTTWGELILPKPCDKVTAYQYAGLGLVLPD